MARVETPRVEAPLGRPAGREPAGREPALPEVRIRRLPAPPGCGGDSIAHPAATQPSLEVRAREFATSGARRFAHPVISFPAIPA